MTTPFLQGVTAKVLGIAALALLMLIPLSQVESLVAERQSRADDATRLIAQRWGEAQQVGGPVLVVPVRRTAMQDNRAVTVEHAEYLLPDRVAIRATLAPEVRSYGLYSSVVYVADVKVEGRFAASDLAVFSELGGEPQWQRAQLRVPVGDVHGIRGASTLHVGDREIAFAPADGNVAGVTTIVAPVEWPRPAGNDAAVPFSFDLTLAGSERLSLLPIARTTTAHVEGAWPAPGFDGAFLPKSRSVDKNGFSGDWQVLDLNRAIAQHWRDGDAAGVDVRANAFGVSLTRPASPYQRNTRAGKYGALFIALTFAAFFLFEVLRGSRVHPVQYLLVGAALCTFYVVLLALSEQAGFAVAYVVAAAAIALLIGGYATAVLHRRSAGITLGTLIAFVYALLYGLVSSEDYALLMGAVALLAAIGALMILTRKVDWYAMAPRTGARDAA